MPRDTVLVNNDSSEGLLNVVKPTNASGTPSTQLTRHVETRSHTSSGQRDESKGIAFEWEVCTEDTTNTEDEHDHLDEHFQYDGPSLIGVPDFEGEEVDYTGPTFYGTDGTVSDTNGNCRLNFGSVISMPPPHSITDECTRSTETPQQSSEGDREARVEDENPQDAQVGHTSTHSNSAQDIATRLPFASLTNLRQLRSGQDKSTEKEPEDVTTVLSSPLHEVATVTDLTPLPTTSSDVARVEGGSCESINAGSSTSTEHAADTGVEAAVDPQILQNTEAEEGEIEGVIQSSITNTMCRWRKADGNICNSLCNTVKDARNHASIAHMPLIKIRVEHGLRAAEAEDGVDPDTILISKQDISIGTHICRWQHGEDEDSICAKQVQVRCFVNHFGSDGHFGFTFTCPNCDKTFVREDSLARHHKTCNVPDNDVVD